MLCIGAAYTVTRCLSVCASTSQKSILTRDAFPECLGFLKAKVQPQQSCGFSIETFGGPAQFTARVDNSSLLAGTFQLSASGLAQLAGEVGRSL